ncbi:DapH/DapD/GlmU-related protein [Elizabethkingia anophelis]|uniref:DapH/DapD/GlmU-related protein n=1 Tax=Elizabethkingia anophelis TaxID=1117645 RepID=UPI003F1CAE06
MINIEPFIRNSNATLLKGIKLEPWEVVNNLDDILLRHIKTLGSEYRIENNIAIHKTATIEMGVILKGTIIVSENCFIGAHAYFRGPVFLGDSVIIGPGSEIKQSAILDHSASAHFNYIGNSIIGSYVNFEAGSICANHYNEREDKKISVRYKNKIVNTNVEKFGSLVGDHCKIGANAVLSPGTILEKYSIVKRLELIEQVK